MKKMTKRIKVFVSLALSSLMLLAVTLPSFASETGGPIIEFDIDPVPIIATIALVFGLLIALIVLFVLLLKHISESKTRIKRLSKIEAEETIQLYDDLEEAKWNKEVIPDDKPRDVLLDDDMSRSAPSSAPDSTGSYEQPRHGPVPERDMPGYTPNSDDSGDEPKPLTSMPTPPTQRVSRQPAPAPQPAPVMQGQMPPAPAPYPYGPVNMQPRIYRPDSDVEIIMRDPMQETAPASAVDQRSAYTSAPAVDSVAAPTRVRAYRRKGRLPAVANVPVNYAAEIAPIDSQTCAAVSDSEVTVPRLNMSHLNIGPLGNASSASNDSAIAEEPKTFNINIEGAETPAETHEPVREAPIVDTGASQPEEETVSVVLEPVENTEKATVEVLPHRRSENEKVVVQLGDDLVDGKLMRTLDDVLDELDDGDVTEFEATEEPIRAEELLFLGADTITADSIPTDEVFEDEEGEAKMFVDGKYTLVRYRTSFMSRFIQSEEFLQDYYSVVKNVLMSYNGVTSEIGWSCETFAKDEKVCAKVNVRDKMLLLYLALDPEKYHNYKYHYTYVYDKYAKYKNSKVSMTIKIQSDRALKYAIELIIDMMSELEIESLAIQDIDYRHSYETTEQLIAEGLIKILPPEDGNAPADKEKVVIDVAEIIKNDMTAIPVEIDGGAVFDFEEESEPIEEVAEEPVEEIVEEPVEEVVEEPVEEVAEEPVEEVVEEPVEEVAEEPIEEVAEELVEEVAEEPVEEVAEEPIEEVAEEPIEEVAEEPIEEVTEEPVEEVAEEPVEEVVEEPVEEVAEEPVEETVIPVIHADAKEADLLLSDQEAIEKIELVEDDVVVRTGKLSAVNLDSICECFNDGDVVTLESLIEKRLVSKNTGRIKILARGVMTKTLTIYADRFSLQAVKMITLAGGHAEQYK